MKSIRLTGLIGMTMLLSQQLFAQPDKTVDEKLSIISTLSINDNYAELPADSILRKHIKLEWITQDEFDAKQKTRVNWLVSDTAKFRKKKGVLRLPTGAGNRSFTDKLGDDESRKEYEYLGQIPFLNSYLVRTMFWEDMAYDLISKKDGAKTGTFSSTPHLSPNKKKIVTVYGDGYDIYTQVAVYAIVNGKFKNTVMVSFENWMPGADDLTFWGADGKLYMPFQYSSKFWKEDGSRDTDYHYLRISFL